MKHSIAVFFRFLAILAVMFIGISVMIPQSTKKDDETVFPVWSDVDIKTDKDIVEVYKQGIITGGKNGKFGVDEPFTADEAAYAVIRINEKENKESSSVTGFKAEDGDKYIKTAIKKNLWNKSLPGAGETLTREELAVVFANVTGKLETLNETDGFTVPDSFTYKNEILEMYRVGMMIEPSVMTAFSPETTVTRGEAVKCVMMYLEPERRVKIVLPDYEALEAQLTEKMSGWQGDWSLYFEDCSNGTQISINSHQVYSASLIKLFVAQTVYQKIANGELASSTKIENEISKMITYSDNEAWKYLARKLGNGSYSKGMAEVTNLAQESDFADTGQFYQGNHKNYNFTSVNDCGAYLRGIINDTVVDAGYSEKILSLLKQQQHLHKIPSGIPDSVVTANKTGELDYMQGDAAIVYAPSRTYILVIIGDSLDNGYGQVSRFTELSETVYNFLN